MSCMHAMLRLKLLLRQIPSVRDVWILKLESTKLPRALKSIHPKHEGSNYFVSHCRSDIKVHKWLCTLYAWERSGLQHWI